MVQIDTKSIDLMDWKSLDSIKFIDLHGINEFDGICG